jgi:serine protease Do
VTVYLDSGDIFDFLAPFSTTLTREGPYLRFLPQGGAERLGVMMIDVTPQLAEYFGTAGGVLIASVRPWSPAERGGLRAGDVVTRVGANTVRTVNDLAQALHRKLSGARLSIGVTRHREAYSIEVRVLQ